MLHRPCTPVTAFDDDLVQLVADMFASMDAADGVGLAANQIGVDARVFVVDCPDAESETTGENVVAHVVNPVLHLPTGRKRRLDLDGEGCLSVPGEYADLARPDTAEVRGVDVHGRPVRIVGTACSPLPAARERPPRRRRLRRPAARRRTRRDPRGGRSAGARVIVLGVESSCDETGVGLVSEGVLLGDALASSMDAHARFGGVVPEVAARAHLEAIVPVLHEALDKASLQLSDVDAVAVTAGPGLSTAVQVGLASAKALAFALDKPLYGVHHLAGHAAVDVLEHGPLPSRCVALVVSGGHTSLLLLGDLGRDPIVHLGDTIDDAAGEAFDKVARVLGLGYPADRSWTAWPARATRTPSPSPARCPGPRTRRTGSPSRG